MKEEVTPEPVAEKAEEPVAEVKEKSTPEPQEVAEKSEGSVAEVKEEATPQPELLAEVNVNQKLRGGGNKKQTKSTRAAACGVCAGCLLPKFHKCGQCKSCTKPSLKRMCELRQCTHVTEANRLRKESRHAEKAKENLPREANRRRKTDSRARKRVLGDTSEMEATRVRNAESRAEKRDQGDTSEMEADRVRKAESRARKWDLGDTSEMEANRVRMADSRAEKRTARAEKTMAPSLLSEFYGNTPSRFSANTRLLDVYLDDPATVTDIDEVVSFDVESNDRQKSNMTFFYVLYSIALSSCMSKKISNV